MNTIREFLDEVWHRTANIPYEGMTPAPSLEKIREEEWSIKFIKAMSNRMVFGRFRYGPIRRQELNSYNFPKDAIRRIKLYQEDGNLEHLVDASNEMMLEFFKGTQNGRSIHPIDDGIHNKKVSL